ncbi:MAG: glutamyl-tRNA reductase [Gammaproteobacteria bacterium]
MPFFTLGISHATAPVAIRERLSFAVEQIPDALRELTGLAGVEEAAILSTCNRTEIYVHLETGSEAQLADWLTHMRSPDDPGVRERFYIHDDEAAARHLFRVACGLDSMILGEPQILGQIKDAYELAKRNGSAGNHLHRLFQYAFAVAKQVRTETRIGDNPVSVAYATVHLARQIFADFSKLTPLLIGAGETIELVSQYLHKQGTQRMIIANRTHARAHQLAEKFGGYAIGLHEIPAHLAEADIVIASSGSPEPIISCAVVVDALKTRKRRPVLMMDIAVPRDIDPAVAELADVYLFTIDDLHSVVENNLRSRQDAAREAEIIIEAQAAQFMEQVRGLDAVPTIRAVRDNAATLRDHTLGQARHLLAGGASPEEALNFLAETLTKRLLHAPTAYLRQAANEGRDHIIRQAHELFGLKNKDKDMDKPS